ncbi:MAG: hypothetical protein P1S46_02575 [bacterium]|nr:hypothetical protein [bacterium]MDT8395009.1 hypothetical protein [bacterium]
MALLRFFLTAVFLAVTAVPAPGHHMGKSVPIAHSGGPVADLAGNVVAAYFEEQLGRDTELFTRSSVEECFRDITEKEAPMALVPVVPRDRIPDGIVIVLPGIDTGQGVFTLAMGSDARGELQFSLVPRYMEKLGSGLSSEAWEKGLARVKAGEGARKVALDMLREGDL